MEGGRDERKGEGGGWGEVEEGDKGANNEQTNKTKFATCLI